MPGADKGLVSHHKGAHRRATGGQRTHRTVGDCTKGRLTEAQTHGPRPSRVQNLPGQAALSAAGRPLLGPGSHAEKLQLYRNFWQAL